MSYAHKVDRRQHKSKQTENRGELGILRSLRARAQQRSRSGLTLGIGDDCALLAPRPGEELAVTTDLSIAGRHFRLDWHSPESVGHRTLARGLSDLAAMGARPVAAFLSLAVPRNLTAHRRGGSWVDRFLEGLLALAEIHKVPLAGGDLAEAPIAVADIVLVGAVERGKALLRSGARPGDLLYVTGSLGGAAYGLERLSDFASRTSSRKSANASEKISPKAGPSTTLRFAQDDKLFGVGAIPKRLAALLAPHLCPQPRIAQGLWLRKRGLATAALDVSDGISTDLRHLCEESGVAAEIDATALPLSPRATLDQALYGGEDYELLFTVPAAARLPRAILGVAITPIGRILKARAGQPLISLHAAEGSQPLQGQGWEHFS